MSKDFESGIGHVGKICRPDSRGEVEVCEVEDIAY